MDRTVKKVILAMRRRLIWFVYRLYDIACSQDIKMFVLVTTHLTKITYGFLEKKKTKITYI